MSKLPTGLHAQLHPFDHYDVGSVIPTGFAAYARILHPAWRPEAGNTIKVRWAEIATWTGRIVHPQVQFHMLSKPSLENGDSHEWHGQPPHEGTLPVDGAIALTAVLAEYTATPQRCWFCGWDGYGWLQGGTAVAPMVSKPRGGATVRHHSEVIPADVLAGPRVRLPHRDYL